ncbi:rhamnosyltransferase [mine drainage metagenome]|uniref:Rhamnosyltransferase n=1 Tax=mine drainage metagenome TaxID=410659 RepID=T1BSQ3_9ZZZZ
MLIPLAVIDAVGGMDAGLFIDNVDLEWSFRMRAASYVLLGVCDARMQHRLGDARRHVPGMPRGVVVHPPLRLYYMMRNRVLLYRLPHVPCVWVAQDVPRVLVKLFVVRGVLIGPRRRNLRCMLRGLWDGSRGRRGPAPGDVMEQASQGTV